MISTHLPSALRTFLLTLAVVDDLLAITIIAVFYTAAPVGRLPLLLALVPLAAVRVLVQRRVRSLVAAAPAGRRSPGRWCTPPGCTPPSPGCCSASPCRWSAARRPAARTPARAWPSTSSTGSGRSRPASRCRSSRSSPPGSPSAGSPGCADALTDPVAARHRRRPGRRQDRSASSAATWLVARFTRAELDDDLALVRRRSAWRCSAGIGFTVSLLIGELAFGAGSVRDEHVKVGVLVGHA